MKQIKINGECPFLYDLEKEPTSYNGVNLGIYNLILTRGSLKLWTKGIKNRGVVLKDIRQYFGISGNAKTLLKKLEVIWEVVSEKSS